MKTIFTSFLLFIIIFKVSYAGPGQPDTVNYKPSIDSLRDNQRKLSVKSDSIKSNIDTIKLMLSNFGKREENFFGKLIVFLPLILFIIFCFYVILKLSIQGYKLRDALSADDAEVISKPNPDFGKVANVSPNVYSLEYPNSASRLLVFLSGGAALIISICLVTYFIYFTLKNPDKSLDMNGLLIVLLSLGIGIIPYSVNKVSSAMGNNNPQQGQQQQQMQQMMQQQMVQQQRVQQQMVQQPPPPKPPGS